MSTYKRNYTRFLRAEGQGPRVEGRSTPVLSKCHALENPHVRLRAAAGGVALWLFLASTSSLMASTINRATKWFRVLKKRIVIRESLWLD